MKLYELVLLDYDFNKLDTIPTIDISDKFIYGYLLTHVAKHFNAKEFITSIKYTKEKHSELGNLYTLTILWHAPSWVIDSWIEYKAYYIEIEVENSLEQCLTNPNAEIRNCAKELLQLPN